MPKISSSAFKLQKLWGLIEYKPQWSLTYRGWLLIAITVTLIIIFGFKQIHSFLAISAPLSQAEVLVVEGWINDEALRGAKVEFDRGNYQFLMTTGEPLARGFYLSSYKNFAELSAATLRAMGVEEKKSIVIPCGKVVAYRTQACALALKDYFSRSKKRLKAINLYSFDVHARRSWLIYKQVLAPEIRVGIIAAPATEYEPKSWWLSSEGFRSVTSETLAYAYIRLRGIFQ